MAAPTFDPDRAARILVDASLIGDVAACDKWKISRVTLFRYRQRMSGDEQLKQVVASKKALLDASWSSELTEALKSSIKRLGDLVAKADVDQLRDVAGAVKILGDLSITQSAIGEDETPDDEPHVEQPRGPESGQEPEETPGPSSPEEDGEQDPVE